MPKHLGVFHLLLLVTTLSGFSTGQDTYYVKPTPDTPCREEPCHTLSEYVNKTEQYFTSNTTFVFLHGEHVLQESIIVNNVGKLAFTGISSSSLAYISRVVCTGAILTFTNISMLEVTDLGFHSCIIELDTSSAVFKNSSFENGTGTFGGAMQALGSTITFEGVTTFERNMAVFGGGIFAVSSYLTFHGNTSVTDNSGGGVIVWHSTVNFGDDSRFINNTGGGISMWDSIVSFSDDSRFINNTGGGVSVSDSTVSFSDDSRFINNAGGGVSVWCSTVNFGDDSRFINNTGGGVSVWYSIVNFGDDSKFISNTAKFGGGVDVSSSTVNFGDESRFIYNVAKYGGGVSMQYNNMSFGGNSNFINNSAEYGGGLYVNRYSSVSFTANSSFITNSAQYDGGGMYVEKSAVSFVDSDFLENSAGYFGGCMAAKESRIINIGSNSHFKVNSARYGGCIFVDTCNITFGEATTLSGNSAITSNWNKGRLDTYNAMYGGGILASNSNLTFHGTQVLANNSAGFGGAVYLSVDSTMYLLPNTSVHFEGNFAQYRGGALFVEDNPFTYCIIDSGVRRGVLREQACFVHLHEAGCEFDDNVIVLHFKDNTANEAGSVLYGGNLDSCAVCTSLYTYDIPGGVAFNTWANISTNLMSSDPYRVCICVDHHPDCSQSKTTYEIFPGVTTAVPLVAFGDYDGTVPAVIKTYTSAGLLLDALQVTQQIGNTCTDLQYTFWTVDMNVWSQANFSLYADEPCSTWGLPLEVLVTFLPCPLGFSLSTEGSCKCDQRLNKYEVYCDINDQSFLRNDNVWIGFDNQSHGLILNPHCPFDYCKPESDFVSFTLNNTDQQCNYNRSGHLCGACQSGLSLALGSSQCLPCSNKGLALLVAFVFAGFALVVFLFVCNLTVSAGAISGLIFYANIVRVNQNVFFPSGKANILTVFIAWLNLDLGIETCFFDGMDAYSMTWLQFVFPVYTWLLVGLITLLCNVSTTAARVLGSINPIAVLATLFYISYTKLLRTIIAALSFTILEYPDDETKVVWLYDGNISYLDKNDGWHIALFLASLLIYLLLLLPYTIFLLFGQCILMLNHNKLRLLSHASCLRMKSFLEAYHAPYKDRHRYWIGLLLVLCLVLSISAAVDIESSQDPHVNLLLIIISMIVLAMWVWNASGGVYKKWYLNMLESSFILNLAILAAATQRTNLAGGNQAAVFYTSVTIAFSTFIGIVIYHVYQRVRESRALINNCIGGTNDLQGEGPSIDEGVEESFL